MVNREIDISRDEKLTEIRNALLDIEYRSNNWIKDIKDIQLECLVIRNKIASLLGQINKEYE